MVEMNRNRGNYMVICIMQLFYEEHFDVLAKETIEVHTILVSYFIYRSSLTYEN